MVLILLVSTLQLSLYKVECLLSGNVQIGLSDFEDCNPKKSKTAINQKCCAFGSLTFDFDYETENTSPQPNLTTASFYENTLNSLKSVEVMPQTEANTYTNLPPPSGYELLKVVQVFRI